MKQARIAIALAIVLGGCQQQGQPTAAGAEAVSGDTQSARNSPAAHPPLGRYVCRQYMTTIGWIELTKTTYATGGVKGGYSYDPSSGAIAWNGGAYAGWPARYEFSPGGGGHAQDENIIRITDEAGALKIDCFLTDQ
jgi:hypothetical protein